MIKISLHSLKIKKHESTLNVLRQLLKSIMGSRRPSSYLKVLIFHAWGERDGRRDVPCRRSAALQCGPPLRPLPASGTGWVCEHPLSRWVSWKSVGEVVRGQMDRKEKFMEDIEGVRYTRRRVRERLFFTLFSTYRFNITDAGFSMNQYF